MKPSKALRIAAEWLEDRASRGNYWGACDVLFDVMVQHAWKTSRFYSTLACANKYLGMIRPGEGDFIVYSITPDGYWWPLGMWYVQRRVLALLLAADIAESEGK